MRKFIAKHKQLSVTIILGLIILLVFSIMRLIGYDGTSTDAEKFKVRADRYFITGDFTRAINFYELALEADPHYEEVYIILYDYYREQGDRELIWSLLSRAVTHTDNAVLREVIEAADYPVQFPCGELHKQVWAQMYPDDPEPGLIWKSDLAAEEFLYTHTFDGEFNALFSQPLIYSHFYLSDLTLDNLDFLRYFESLTVLHILRSDIADISYLANMTNLTALSLSKHYYDFIIDDEDDFEFFWDSSMERMPLDLSLLSDMTSLELINITGYIITDISPLIELHNLTSIRLQSCQITDISPFAGNLQRQMFFDFSHNNITDISTLDDWQTVFVNSMILYGNPIADTSPAGRFGSKINFEPPAFMMREE